MQERTTRSTDVTFLRPTSSLSQCIQHNIILPTNIQLCHNQSNIISIAMGQLKSCFTRQASGVGGGGSDEKDRAAKPVSTDPSSPREGSNAKKEPAGTATEVGPDERASPDTHTQVEESPETVPSDPVANSILNSADQEVVQDPNHGNDGTAASVRERRNIADEHKVKIEAEYLKPEKALVVGRQRLEARVRRHYQHNYSIDLSPVGLWEFPENMVADLPNPNNVAAPTDGGPSNASILRINVVPPENIVSSRMRQLRRVVQTAIYSDNGFGRALLFEVQDEYGRDSVRLVLREELVQRTKSVVYGKENAPDNENHPTDDMTTAQLYHLIQIEHTRVRQSSDQGTMTGKLPYGIVSSALRH